MRACPLIAALIVASSANAAVFCKVDKDCGSPCGVGTCGRGGVCSFDPVPRKGILCRAANGDCDKAEFCDGVSADCPADAFLQGNVCRPAANDCDVSDTCTGTSKDCPSDSNAPSGTACENASACFSGGSCSGPVCIGGQPELTFAPDPAQFPPGVRQIDILVKHTGRGAPIELTGVRLDPIGAFLISAATNFPLTLASGDQVHLTARIDPNAAPGDHPATLFLQATACAEQPLQLHAVVDAPNPAPAPDAGSPGGGSPAPDGGSGPVASSGSTSGDSGKSGGCSSGPAPVEALALAALAAAGLRRRRSA